MSARRNPETEFSEYEGLLAEPLSTPNLLSDEAEWEEWAGKLTEKMCLLMRHFGLDPADQDAFRKVAEKLAQRHVPGFMPPRRKQGRPRERNDDDLTLVVLFQLLMVRDGVGERAASETIEKVGRVRGKSETLRKRYRQRANGDLRPLLRLLENVKQRIGTDKFITVLEQSVDNVPGEAGVKKV
jgi:hypothetical protein